MPHTKNRAVQVDVLTPAQFKVESCPNFEQAADATENFHLAGGWLSDARKDFEECGFARAVAPDDANHFARLDFKADIFQAPNRVDFTIPMSPNLGERSAECLGDRIAKRRVWRLPRAYAVLFA